MDIANEWARLQHSLLTGTLQRVNDHQLFLDAQQEKARIEVEQFAARLMYKPCFTGSRIDGGPIPLQKKFRYLAEYFYRLGEYHKYGEVVMASIIKEWPVKITYAEKEREKDCMIWDRAPIFIAIKESAIRKEGHTYVNRVLALEEEDMGTRIVHADVKTFLYQVDEFGSDVPARGAYVHELRQEKGKNKESAQSAPSNAHAPARNRKTPVSKKRDREDTLSPMPSDAVNTNYFECRFDYSLAPDGSGLHFVSRPGLAETDFISQDSAVLQFKINNISIHESSNRSTINQKYVLKTLFRFVVKSPQGEFMIRTTIDPPTSSGEYPYVVRSMEFEASTNPSTHWKKMFLAIWKPLYIYHQQSNHKPIENKDDAEIELEWGKVKEMLSYFIGCQSDIYVRCLDDSELRTIQRMILARRLLEMNESYGGVKKWVIDDLGEKEHWKIEEELCGERLNLARDGYTFTELINHEMQRRPISDNFLVRSTDFTESLISFSSAYPVFGSGSIYTWLRSAAAIIAGPMLHSGEGKSGPKTSIRMFNRNLITLRSEESACRLVQTIINRKASLGECENVLMIRIDERDEGKLMFEYVDATYQHDVRHYFGCMNAKTIKTMRCPIDPRCASSSFKNAAREDGVLEKNGKETNGLFALLKTGYMARFKRIAEPGQQLRIVPLFDETGKGESGDAHPVYLYDFVPAEMMKKEINPIIGPMSDVPSNLQDRDETLTMPESVLPSLKRLSLSGKGGRPVHNHISHQSISNQHIIHPTIHVHNHNHFVNPPAVYANAHSSAPIDQQQPPPYGLINL